MAPKKKNSEGIALLSVYSDEDDEEMEDAEEEGDDEEEQKRHEGAENGLEGPPDMEENMKEQDSRIADAGNSSVHATPRSIENDDLSRPGSAGRMNVDSETVDGERTGDIPGESNDTLLDKFLPPPPNEKCSDELQRKIDKFLNLKRIGKSFNAEVRNRKDYRNPDFLLHTVRYQDIDQIGSCFSKDVFDPHGYDPSDFYDVIEVDMKRERERKDQESKKNQKLDFVSVGSSQPGTMFSGPKSSLPLSADPAARDGRPNKKSKWDEVDAPTKSLHFVGSHELVSSFTSKAAAVFAASSELSSFFEQEEAGRRRRKEIREAEEEEERRRRGERKREVEEGEERRSERGT